MAVVMCPETLTTFVVSPGSVSVSAAAVGPRTMFVVCVALLDCRSWDSVMPVMVPVTVVVVVVSTVVTPGLGTSVVDCGKFGVISLINVSLPGTTVLVAVVGMSHVRWYSLTWYKWSCCTSCGWSCGELCFRRVLLGCLWFGWLSCAGVRSCGGLGFADDSW